MNYEYDVFLSYIRDFPFGHWVHETFLPLFQPLLSQALNRPANIFIDTKKISPGDAWHSRLKYALAHSRCLVAVWSPSYFSSPWCSFELSVMLERESQLGYRSDQNPKGLIIPVRVFDGEHFPDFAQRIHCLDCSNFARVGPAFRKTKKFIKFQDELFEWVPLVAKTIDQAPIWRQEWLDAKLPVMPYFSYSSN
ncbi:MAG: toll/interleukin-1 receptor domain-containing protein, partial [Chloroflexota bacterium]